MKLDWDFKSNVRFRVVLEAEGGLETVLGELKVFSNCGGSCIVYGVFWR